jgi:para-aminobenzoate synthetase component 1
MTTQASILFRDDIAGEERRFADPAAIITADDAGSFFPALEALEQAHQAGKWLAGYFSYEAGYLLEPKLRPILPPGRRVPLLNFGVFDKPRDTMPTPSRVSGETPVDNPRALWRFEDYRARFDRLHRHLRKGDCYQGNLTFPVAAQWRGDPTRAFDVLASRQPVRHGALVALGGPIILSRSPELFFEVSADGWIESLPMKGTARRGKTDAEDERLKQELANDPKNQAENRMIVDLLRNDISRISEVGTLSVPQLFHIESYATLHQMVSRVRAKLLRRTGISQIFAALFPCGSITGAPKIRAMEILNELEGAPRGAYCGSIGWIAPNGEMRFNVAIRTLTLFDGGEAIYNVGGGVVFDSTAESEYRECLLKARFVTGQEPATN